MDSYITKIAFGELLKNGFNPKRVFTNITYLNGDSDEEIVSKVLNSKCDIEIW